MRTREELEQSIAEAMNLSVIHEEYLIEKLSLILQNYSSSKMHYILENIEKNIYEICKEEPTPNISKIQYIIEKIEKYVYEIMLL